MTERTWRIEAVDRDGPFCVQEGDGSAVLVDTFWDGMVRVFASASAGEGI